MHAAGLFLLYLLLGDGGRETPTVLEGSLADLLSLPERDDDVAAALRQRNWARVLCRCQDPNHQHLGGLQTGYAALQLSDWSMAEAGFQEALALGGELQDWALWGLGKALAENPENQRDGGLVPEARHRILEAWLKIGPDSPRWRQVKEFVCTAQEPNAQVPAICAVPAGDQRPSGDVALERLYSAHRYRELLGVLEKALADARVTGDERCRLSFWMGKTLGRTGRETASLPWLERVYQDCRLSAGVNIEQTLYLLSDHSCRAGNLDLCRKAARRIEKTYPSSRFGDDALLGLARLHERRGNPDTADRTVERLFRLFPNGDMAPDAAFLKIFREWKAGRFRQAQTAAEHYLSLASDWTGDYRTAGRISYWKARAIGAQRRGMEARSLYREILCRRPLSWYSLLSFSKLHRPGRDALRWMTKTCGKKADLPEPGELSLEQASPGLVRAARLYALGLEIWAQAELSRVSWPKDEKEALLQAAFFSALGVVEKSHDILRRACPSLDGSLPEGAAVRWWKLAFPRPFMRIVEPESAASGVPPSLTLAITREESGFNPRAKSYAHAMGLMQLLKKTARWIGKPLGLRPDEEDLYRPEVNIRLGARYLGMLLEELGHPALAAAAYNCGGGCVRKLLARNRGTDLDEFVELIPYAQTQRYTKRVIGSAAAYQLLYEGRLYPEFLRSGLDYHRKKRAGRR